MGFSRQEYWSELPCPPDPGIELLTQGLNSWPRDWTRISVSCVGRWVLYHWCHLLALYLTAVSIIPLKLLFQVIKDFHVPKHCGQFSVLSSLSLSLSFSIIGHSPSWNTSGLVLQGTILFSSYLLASSYQSLFVLSFSAWHLMLGNHRLSPQLSFISCTYCQGNFVLSLWSQISSYASLPNSYLQTFSWFIYLIPGDKCWTDILDLACANSTLGFLSWKLAFSSKFPMSLNRTNIYGPKSCYKDQ